jgi:hypothetical protein
VGAAAVSVEIPVAAAGQAPVPGRWPAAAFDGANHLLSWPAAGGIPGARIAPDGTVLDATPILISSLGPSQDLGPVAGFDGTNHVIAVARYGEDEQGYELYRVLAVRVTPQGTVLDADPIEVGTEGHRGIERASGGRRRRRRPHRRALEHGLRR